MSKIEKRSLKKSNLNAKSDFDLYQLKRKSYYLLNCEITRSMDEVTFVFELNDEQTFDNVRNLTLAYKYQLLINVSHLFEEARRISISLDPSNIYFDINMMPKAMMRDIYEDAKFNEEDLIKQYKSLIGYVLQEKYSFVDYYKGGNQLLLKNKATAPFVALNNFEGIVTALHEEYKTLQKKLQYSIIEVDKKKYRKTKITNRIMIILLVAVTSLAGYFGFYRLNEEVTFNKANEFYIKQDYVSVLKTLERVRLSRMNTNTKYILSISNIKAESLTDEQKSNILSSISLNSDERILEFWVLLGQKDIEKAIDIAKQLGNKEYIAYAYMKQKANVENDKSLSGNEREQELKVIEENLKNTNIIKNEEVDENK